MDFGNVKKKKNVKGDDRLSNLPDDLIQKILSFVNIKPVIQTSVLSSRWRFIWKSLPYLRFSSDDFESLPKFSKFVLHVLSCRNKQIDVPSVELIFGGKSSQFFVKRILNYAFSHNIQQLTVTSLGEKYKYKTLFPLSLINSHSLKHLTMAGSYSNTINATSTWYLPSLTTWHLEHVIFCDDIPDKSNTCIFSKCVNLKNLYLRFCHMARSSNGADPKSCIIPMSALEIPTLTTLRLDCITLCDDNNDKSIGLFSKCANLKNLTLYLYAMTGSKCLSIYHPRLSNFTLENANVEVVKLVAPQLENLTITGSSAEHVISTPHLASVIYRCSYSHPLLLSAGSFHSLEKADISVFIPHAKVYPFKKEDICNFTRDNAQKIVCLLQQLHSVKYLTLNSELVQILSSSLELIPHQPSPFANLKSLKIYPDPIDDEITLSSKVKNYLLDSSPRATFTMVSSEEIRALMNASSARNLMGKLQDLLVQCEDDIETNTSHMDQGEASTESHNANIDDQGKAQIVNQRAQSETMEKQWNFGGKLTRIERHWNDLNEEVVKGKEKTSSIISLLRQTKILLNNVPTSRRADMQSRFSNLSAEADITMKKLLDRTKIQLD